MKKLQKVLLNILGSVGRMKVRGLPRALVIVLMLLIIGSIFCTVLAGSGCGRCWGELISRLLTCCSRP